MILSTPYLALIALMSVLLATIAAIMALVWAVALTAYRLARRLLYARHGSNTAGDQKRLEPVTARALAEELIGLAFESAPAPKR